MESDDNLRPELTAAKKDALDSLRRDILSVHLAPELTVRQFIERTDGSVVLQGLISNAEQRGGTRWRSEQTCEVRLEVSGADLADVLQKLALERRERLTGLNIRPSTIQRGLSDLRDREFSSLGRSTGGANLQEIQPPAGSNAWESVSADDRRQAVLAAKCNAVARVIESLRAVDLGDGKRMDEALEAPEVDKDLRQWVAGRPVVGCEFQDDLQVRVTLSAAAEEFWPVIRSALARHHFGPPEGDAEAWQQLRAAVLAAMAPASGRGAATTPGAEPVLPAAAELPHDPPAWVSDQIRVEATVQGSGLRAARAAETNAISKMREQLDALSFDKDITLGQAAKANARVEHAVASVIRRAPTTKVDYAERGVVKVRVALDLDQLWRELDAAR